MLSVLECPPKSDLDARIDEYLDSTDPEVAAMGCTAIAKVLGCHHETVLRRKRARESAPARPAPEPVLLDLEAIVLDDRLQMRPRLDMHQINGLGEMVDDLDPVEVMGVDGVLYLAHGFHRWHAHKLEGRTQIRAVVHVGTFADALEVACRANAKHQVQRCPETVEKAVRTYKGLHPGASHAEVARALSVGRERVGTILAGFGSIRERRQSRAGSNGPTVNGCQPVGADRSDQLPSRVPVGADRSDQLPPVEREPGEDDDLGLDDEPRAHGEADARADDLRMAAAVHGLPPDLADDIRVLPLWEVLEGRDTRAAFARDAVLYFRLREAKEALGNLHRRHMPKAEAGVPKGHYQYVVERFLSTPHPSEWLVCRRCDGAGCQSCLRRGYSIQGVR